MPNPAVISTTPQRNRVQDTPHPNSEDDASVHVPVLGDSEEARLVNEFDVPGSNAHQIFDYDDDDDDDDYKEGDDDEPDGDGDEEDLDSGAGDGEHEGGSFEGPSSFTAFQTQTRIQAAKRSEGNRRAGGIKTQKAMVRAWEVCSRIIL